MLSSGQSNTVWPGKYCSAQNAFAVHDSNHGMMIDTSVACVTLYSGLVESAAATTAREETARKLV
jgi:hypothetical protein